MNIQLTPNQMITLETLFKNNEKDLAEKCNVHSVEQLARLLLIQGSKHFDEIFR